MKTISLHMSVFDIFKEMSVHPKTRPSQTEVMLMQV